ncbi:ATP-binding cassette domain-containing protein [Novosphingobium sp.]|uniref:ATP-binding cassette domain-containing protein n=1 Tax=Novosphingobium sp. TaxID=1874826 RepID=UPI003BA87F00
MIRVDGLSHAYAKGRPIFSELDLVIPTNRRVAILGGTGSGKTTLLNLLAGIEAPQSGRIERHAHLSFPGGFQRGFRQTSTMRQNAMFAARIYGADPDEVVEFLSDVCLMQDELEFPLRELSVQTRIAFSYLLTYTLPFDCYLFDNVIGPPQPEVRELCARLYAARAAEAGTILATRQPRLAELYCDCGIVLGQGGARFFDTIADALAAFDGSAQPAAAPAASTAPVADPIDEAAAQPAVLTEGATSA